MDGKKTLLPVRYEGRFCYNIMIESGFEALSKAAEKVTDGGRKICIVTDDTVGPLYADAVREMLSAAFSTVSVYTIKSGEEFKTLDTVRGLYEHLILNRFDRKDMLAALGGGVCGDLTGFAAATYLRGIDFIQIPTTLLSQVDSSIGGKTGVDFDSYKNMVGAFHMPRLVYMNLSVLDSLPERQFASGMAEIIKHGLIKNREYFYRLLDNRERIRRMDREALSFMIEESCRVKRDVVERDPTEKGERALLNFGHTLGHAIEKLMNFTLYHGECVALGAVAASYISHRRGLISSDELDDIMKGFESFGLPVKYVLPDKDDIIRTVKSDKKMDAGKVRFVLLSGIGSAHTDRTVSDEEMRSALDFISLE